MTTALVKKPRSLAKLAPLIRKELKAGFQAGERHWRIVGKLLNEARGHFPASGPNAKGLTFHQWAEAEFLHPMTNEPLSRNQVKRWMFAARGSDRGRAKLSMSSYTDRRLPDHRDHNPSLDWQTNVRKVQQAVLKSRALQQDWVDKAKEREARLVLAQKIVDAGYRALAAVVHPDKPGGSAENMSKLTAARKWLNDQIRRHQ